MPPDALPTAAAPLLSAENVRIDFGAASIDALSASSTGGALVISDETYALLAAISGAAHLSKGELRLLGKSVSKRAHTPLCGLCPLDPPLPAEWTVREYLTRGARLVGHAPASAAAKAITIVEQLGIADLLPQTCGALATPERRAVVLAQALAGDPEVLVAATPLAQLAGPAAAYVSGVLFAAIEGRKSIVSVSEIRLSSAEHELAERADELWIIAAGQLARAGKLATLRENVSSYSLSVHGNAQALQESLLALGAKVKGGPLRFWVDLPSSLSTSDLLALSVEKGAPIIELTPRLLPPP